MVYAVVAEDPLIILSFSPWGEGYGEGVFCDANAPGMISHASHFAYRGRHPARGDGRGLSPAEPVRGSACGGRRLGLAALRRKQPDLVLLDLMLPDANGLDLFREIRALHPSAPVPVIMLTARGDPMDRVVGLEMGAEDYIPKPFEPRELFGAHPGRAAPGALWPGLRYFALRAAGDRPRRAPGPRERRGESR